MSNQLKVLTDPQVLNQTSDGINIVEYYQHDYTKSKFIFNRYESKFPTKVQNFKTSSDKTEIINYLKSEYKNCIEFYFSESIIRIIEDQYFIIDITSKSNKLVELEIVGDTEFVNCLIEKLKDNFTEISVMIEWMYSDDGSRFDIPLTPPKYEVTDVAYPYIDGGINKFIDDFKHSSENILLLLGKPGTGKSTFLKHLLSVLDENAIVTYDTKILEKDYFFGDFMMGNNNVLIMEDADMFLEARTSGNALMHKFLNVGDGLVSAPNKKIIFTTNLESSDNIDKALLRPGRCFAVVNFRPLTNRESKNFMGQYDKTFDSSNLTNSEYTLAELYNQVRNRKVVETKTKVGFY